MTTDLQPPQSGASFTSAGKPPKPPPPTGLKILLWMGLGFLLLAIVLMGTCTYCVVQNPEARKMGALIGESVKMGLAATKAPGTVELRAAGCDEAMVMDMHDFMKLVHEIDTKAEKKPSELDWQTMVVCQVQMGTTKLTCEHVARTYAHAVPNPPAKFAVGIQVRLPRQDVCQGLYAPDGTRMGDIPKHEAPVGSGPGGMAGEPEDEERNDKAPADSPAEEDSE